MSHRIRPGDEALDLRAGPVFVAAEPGGGTEAVQALVVRATLAGGHRRVQTVRVLNGWVVCAFDE